MVFRAAGRLHTPILVGVHLLWWAALFASALIFVYSHRLGIGKYDIPCSGIVCESYFQLTAAQSGQLSSFGITPELYGGMTVILLAVQNVSSWLVGFLLYRYGWKDRYCVTASMMLIVTGTMFSTDEMAIGDHAALILLLQGHVMLGLLYPLFFFLLPEGRFVPSWMTVPALSTVVLLILSLSFAESPYLNFMLWPHSLRDLYAFGIHLLILVSQYCRYGRGASDEQKRQIRWFLTSMGAFTIAQAIEAFAPSPQHGAIKLFVELLLYSGLLFLPFSVGVMVLESRLRRMSVAFNRTLVFIVLSVMSITAYALLVGVIGLLLQGKSNTLVSLIAIGLVAVLFHPLRNRITREVNLLVYGERNNPYQALSGLMHKLESTLTQQSILHEIAVSIAHAFKIPFVSIDITKNAESVTIAEYGADAGVRSIIPLTVQGETVGRLTLGVSRMDDVLPPNKLAMLDDLVRQVSIAVQAHQLTDELYRSRERLVNAREEERKRLRRDLHDGLGSAIASTVFRLDEALQLWEREPERAKSIVDSTRKQLKETIHDIRRLVYALRPPALDEFGLLFALDELADQFCDGAFEVRMEYAESGFMLHPAIEVAVYRIVQEALTNAHKHAKAERCHITLACADGYVHLDIRDNGIGMNPERRHGVGIRSMRERAEELGGTFALHSRSGEGTQINVRLPYNERGREAHDGPSSAAYFTRR
jgi:signal transduction histidine kinase